MELFFPSRSSFPSISSTGTSCELSCAHCNSYYLRSMADASSCGLYDICAKARSRGAIGALISGGSDRCGMVPHDYKEISRICGLEPFLINIHTGLLRGRVPEELCLADVVSVDIPPSDNAVRDVLGIEACQKDYFEMLEMLESEKIRYAPHLCLGLENAHIRGEYATLELLESYDFESLVILTLKRTPGAPMTYSLPEAPECENVIKAAREKFKNLTLGCMRDRSRKKEQLWHYFDKIAWPSSIIKEEISRADIDCTKAYVCCSV